MVFMALTRRSIQQLDYSMAMSELKESTENKYLGHRLFTLENQRGLHGVYNLIEVISNETNK